MVDSTIKSLLIGEMDETIKAVRTASGGLVDLIPTIKNRYKTISDTCINLETRLSAAELTDEMFAEIRQEHEENQILWKRTVTMIKTYPTGLGLAIIAYIIIFILSNERNRAIIVDALSGLHTIKYIVASLCGLFLYFLSNRLSSAVNVDNALSSLQEWLVRLAIASIVPVVLVLLFVNDTGVFDLRLNFDKPEIVSFACGYSAKLVMEFLNKIVDKVSTIIQAL